METCYISFNNGGDTLLCTEDKQFSMTELSGILAAIKAAFKLPKWTVEEFDTIENINGKDKLSKGYKFQRTAAVLYEALICC